MKTLIKYVSSHLSKESGFDYRLLLVSVILVYFIAIVLIGGLADGDYAPLWRAAGVPVMKPPFADLRGITSGLDCYRNGVHDVISANPCDPWHRPVNHPPIWFTLLAPTGISEKHTELLGTLIAVLFIASILALVNKLTVTEAIIYGFIVCSPGIMLAIERGNSDIIIFLLLFLVTLLSKHDAVMPNLISRAILLFAAILKLYPVFSLIYYVKEKPKRFFITAGSLMLLFLVYSLYYCNDFITLFKVTPRAYFLSYGAFVYVDGLKAGLEGAGFSLNSTALHAIMLGIAATVLMTCIYKSMRRTAACPFDEVHIDGFRIGASIFVGTFFIGNNFDYRLIFLIFTMPQLMAWGKHPDTLGYLSIAALSLLVIRLWGEWWTVNVFPPFFIPLTYLLKHVAEWLLFAFYSYALIETIPNLHIKRQASEASGEA